jgi:hypothetical protein
MAHRSTYPATTSLPLKILVRAGLVLVVSGALLVASLGWRLSRGPIPLSVLVPRIEAALSGMAPDLIARVGRAELVWTTRVPELRVLDVRLFHRDGAAVASLPTISLRPSLRALTRGRIAVGWIGVDGVRLALARSADGSITLATGDQGPAGGGMPGLVGALIGDRSGADRASYLSRIHVRDAGVGLDDRSSSMTWEIDGAGVDIVLRSDGLVAQLRGELAVRSETSPFLRELVLPVALSAEVSVDTNGKVLGVAFHTNGTDGRIVVSGANDTPIPLHALRVEGSYAADSGALDVRHLEAALGSARLDATATLEVGSGDIAARGELRSLAVADLRGMWPRGVGGATREWITANVRDGVVPRCRFTLRLPPQAARSARPPAGAVDVGCELEGLTVDYLRPLDPLRMVRGSAKLTAERFEAKIVGATTGGLEVRRGRMEIDLRRQPVQASVVVETQGPTAALLALLNSPPLGIRGPLGIAPDRVGGGSDVHAEIRFPLSGRLAAEDVRVTARADLREARVPEVLAGIGIEDGHLRVSVDGRRVAVEGASAITGVPALTGAIAVALVVEPAAEGATRWQARFDGEGFHAAGRAALDDGGLRTLTLERLELGKTDLSAEVARVPGGRYQASVGGARLDVEPLLARLGSETAVADLGLRAPWDVDIDLRGVSAGGDLQLTDIRGRASGAAQRVRTLRAAGTLAAGGRLEIELAPAGEKQRLILSSDRGGQALKALGLYPNARDGRLSLAATLDGDGSPRRVEGRLEMTDFRVTQAPVLAEVLSLGSLGGIAGMLRREGLAFTRARIPFAWSDGRLEVREGRAVGAIGITVDGVIDRNGDRIDLRGDVIPYYTLNSALGHVPLLGRVVTGGSGKDVFGIEYAVRGKLDDPDVTVNPLSALAPDVLRRMFLDPFAQP